MYRIVIGLENKMAVVRNTKAQEAVLELLQRSKKTLTADDIINTIDVSVNKTTIYRMLDRFVAAGKVHFVTDTAGKAHYALCTSSCLQSHSLHNHLHFQCKICNQVECLPVKLEVPELENYEVHDMQFLSVGICFKCKQV
ncbi:Fur family transcriptional regulator [Formosa sp. A9]|uniref:Fur family transcriptional regulator n=1 Tax=Formosa sp. A9 TaxID=3442641 RepID=UPI003EBECDA0